MVGYSQTTTTADSSYFDKNGKLIVPGDTVPGPSATLAAIVPEVGVSYWLTPQARLNLGSSYYFTTQGHNHDFLMSGLSFEFIPGSSFVANEPHVQEASPELNQVMESEPYFKAEKDREALDHSIHVYDGHSTLPPEPSKTDEETTD